MLRDWKIVSEERCRETGGAEDSGFARVSHVNMFCDPGNFLG